MIISVAEVRSEINDFKDWSDAKIERKLKAIEDTIRSHTNNRFQNRNIRLRCPIVAQRLYGVHSALKVGDTVQVTGSQFNDGLYVIKSIEDNMIEVDVALIDEAEVMITKVIYPADVVECALDMLEYELNKPDASKRGIQSETLSRHSITYAQPSDANMEKGYPKDIMDALQPYMKARF